jgi:hypothetical protein
LRCVDSQGYPSNIKSLLLPDSGFVAPLGTNASTSYA